MHIFNKILKLFFQLLFNWAWISNQINNTQNYHHIRKLLGYIIGDIIGISLYIIYLFNKFNFGIFQSDEIFF